MRGIGRWIALTVCGLLLAGCTIGKIQHNDVLIFGTDTKLALDVSANPTTGGTPEVTIGYKRQEAVWMPLVVNGRGISGAPLQTLCVKPNGAKYDLAACDANATPANWACLNSAGNGYLPCAAAPLPRQQICGNDVATRTLCSFDLETRKYVGSAEPRDGKPGGTDAYSVFASFGANIKGSGEGGAQVGLAQFFATGIAAQRLAANSQVASALSVQPPATGVAMAAASAAPSAATLDGIRMLQNDQAVSMLLSSCAATHDPATLFDLTKHGIDPGAPKRGSAETDLKGAKTSDDFLALIRRYPQFSGAMRSIAGSAACQA
jgi:hypothetical protein